IFTIIISSSMDALAATSPPVHVDGYFRKDGTYVAPHFRSAPDGNPYNNYSFPGNINPYTGKKATGNPDTYLENYYKNSKSYFSGYVDYREVEFIEETEYFLSTGEYEKALSIARATVKTNPSYYSIHILGLCYENLKDYDNAIMYYKKALEYQKSNEYYALYNLASSYYMKECYKEAIDYAEKCLVKVKLQYMYYILGNAYYQLEDYINAQKYLSIYLNMSKTLPDYEECEDSDVYYFFACSLNKNDQLIDAIVAINRALHIDKSTANYFALRADVYYKLGNYEQSIKDINKAISICNKPEDKEKYIEFKDKLNKV
ncbi:MAG: tetratricopeptide repeat protein, partial [Gottschalkiaceae bacterium]